MNAHSHTEFGLADGNYEDFVGIRYAIDLEKPLGEFSAGDVLTFETDEEPGAGDTVALRRPGIPGVQIGTLVTHLPTARWADMPFGDAWGESTHTFAFQALADDTPEIIDMARLVGIDLCVDVQRADVADDKSPTKSAKPTPARDVKGRFLKPGHTELETEVSQPDERKPWDEAPDWTPTERFMFNLEGQLYELTALASTLETLLTPLTHKMAGYDRPSSAALDYAATHLADAIEAIEERYIAVRFPDKEAA